MSAMTLLSAKDGADADYLEFAERLAASSSSPRADLAELWLRIAVGIAIGNTDDHLRNHGLLRTPIGWRLAPAFDLNPNPHADVHQTSLLGASTADEMAAALMESSADFGIDQADARLRWAKICETVASWRTVARSNGVRLRELDVVERAFQFVH